ncbi:PQQ-dependent sugar dehydrogenase, partial [Vibrio sp. 10N.286.51.A4]
MKNHHRLISCALALIASSPISSAFAWQVEKITDGLVIPW